MAPIVLDASAILAHLGSEPGSERLAGFLGEAYVSAVNYAEIVGKLAERGAALPLIKAALARYGFLLVPFDETLAIKAGALRSKARALGLSLGDRACLATAWHLNLPVLTVDRLWKEVDLPVEIHLLR